MEAPDEEARGAKPPAARSLAARAAGRLPSAVPARAGTRCRLGAAMSAGIRPITSKDIPALLPLVEQYWIFEDVAGFDAARVTKELQRFCADDSLGNGWIACINGQPVGYLLAVYVFSLEHLGLTAEIDEFFVLPSARGKGLGDELLELAEAEFIRRGCTNVALQLGKGNDRRARLLSRARLRRARRLRAAGQDAARRLITGRRGTRPWQRRKRKPAWPSTTTSTRSRRSSTRTGSSTRSPRTSPSPGAISTSASSARNR